LDNTDLVDSNISKANFRGADLRTADFWRQTLFDPDNNKLVDFRRKVTKADLVKSNATFDSTTKFSE